jgi:hypothetical protein
VGNAYFDAIGSDGAWTRYRSDPATAGPWASHLQHGGPPSALLVLAAERAAREIGGRTDLVAMRLAVEFVGPVPVTEVQVRTDIVRAARSGTLVSAVLSADGRDCLHGRVWLIRTADTESIAAPAEPTELPADLPDLGAGFPYGDSIEWRVVHGGLRVAGPGAAWARPRMPILAEVEPTGLQRAALIGDSASGLSSALDWQVWSFLNVDLDIHLSRPPHGDWLLLDAHTTLGTDGAGLATARLADELGTVGRTLQTLVVEPRAR